MDFCFLIMGVPLQNQLNLVMLHNGIYPLSGKSFELSLFSIYVSNFLLFCIYEIVYLFLLNRISSFIFRERFFESTLQNVQSCLITHKNSTIVYKNLEVRYVISRFLCDNTGFLVVAGYHESNIVPI